MPVLDIAPQRPSLDTELHVRLSGVAPGAAVTLRATQPGWASTTTFHAAGDGTVDLTRDTPADGAYPGPDPMGLIWSMRRTGSPARDPLTPVPLTVTAELGGVAVAEARVERLRIPDGLVRTDVRDDGLVGVRFQPDTAGTAPGVLLLGGSEGGLHVDDAALLAAHGYTVLALAYFGAPGVPPTLQEIPLEYFESALRHLRAVTGDRVAVVGGSKGGEAALLLGATFPEHVRAVVSLVGAGVVGAGISQSIATGSFLDIMAAYVPCWTHHGRPLPGLPTAVTAELEALVDAGEPVPLRLAFAPGLARTDLLPDAGIPVERIAGPVLLVSGGDDQAYGPAGHEFAAARLAGHPYPWEHLVFPGAGHLIAQPPYGPTTERTTPGPGVTLDHGGTPAATARARAGAWRQTLRYLQLPV